MSKLHISRVTNPIALERLYQFRYSVYVEELHWLDADSDEIIANDNKMLIETFDEYAYNYAAYDPAGKVIGSVRIVPDSILGLPMEMSYGSLNNFRNNNALLVEVDHLMVAKTHRNISLFIRLIKTAIER